MHIPNFILTTARYAALVLVSGLRLHKGPFGPRQEALWASRVEAKISTKKKKEEKKESWIVLSDTRSSGHNIPFLIAPAEGIGSSVDPHFWVQFFLTNKN